MRVHLGDRGSAVMRFSENVHALSLDLLLVPVMSRNQGLGSLLLQRFCALADALDKTAYATLRPVGTAPPQALARQVAFFQRFGFVVVEERPGAVDVERAAGDHAGS
jgi:N-acetylglutamate synthase-like GNAT family acetyltransferase